MAAPEDEILTEAVRKFPVLYDKCRLLFKDAMKKALAREDVAKMVGLQKSKLCRKFQLFVAHSQPRPPS